MKTLVAFVIGLIAAPILLAVAGIAGFLPSNATSSPPGWESSIGMRILDASLEKRSDGLKNPIGANDKAALAAGGKIYADNCAGCHGDTTGPSQWGSKGFYPRVPQFYQGAMIDSPEEAFVAIHDGIRYSGMGAWRGQLSDSDIWKVSNFVGGIHPMPAGKKMD
jgi:mono/diheme cytochrome c family protein